MQLSDIQSQFLLLAASKALATISREGVVNVVPVSSIKVLDGKILLVNYFMDKTLENILANPDVSLVAWTKMIGYQVKGSAQYKTSGDTFDMVVAWIREMLPERTVHGVVIIEPTEIFDIAPDKKTDEHFKEMKNISA